MINFIFLTLKTINELYQHFSNHLHLCSGNKDVTLQGEGSVADDEICEKFM